MGMFGNSVGGGGMFGIGGSPTRSPYETPGYGGGVNFEQFRQQMPQQQPMQQGYTPRKLSFMDRLGMFGEALQGRDTTRQRLSEQDMAEQRYQRQRADSASDDERNFQQQMQIAQYSRENPAPHYFETNDGSQGRIGPDGVPQILYKDPTPKTTYITADNADGTKQVIPVINGVPQFGGGGAGRPQIGAVISDPRKGGTSPQGGGTFRP